MKLLLINNEFPPIGGGGSTVTKYALRYLVKAGHEVTLLTSRYKDLPHQEEIDGATVIRVPAIRRFKDYAALWELVVFGFSALVYALVYSFRQRVDFVQAYFAVPAGWVAWILSMTRGIPYGVYFGGSDIPGANPSRYRSLYPIITPLLKLIWRPAVFRSVCSEGLATLGRQADPSVEFMVIPNGVETERFTPVNRPENSKVRILFIGRLIPRKGLQRVIQVLPQVRTLVSRPFEVEVVGTGTYQNALDEQARNLGVSELIRYAGIVPYDQLEKSYQNADIFVLTSLSEGMPAVILEAMGCGLPIIASDVGGNNELVHEGENGYLISGDDADLLAKRLVALIEDADLRKRMGSKSRELSEGYDWEKIMGMYDELYRHETLISSPVS